MRSSPRGSAVPCCGAAVGRVLSTQPVAVSTERKGARRSDARRAPRARPTPRSAPRALSDSSDELASAVASAPTGSPPAASAAQPLKRVASSYLGDATRRRAAGGLARAGGNRTAGCGGGGVADARMRTSSLPSSSERVVPCGCEAGPSVDVGVRSARAVGRGLVVVALAAKLSRPCSSDAGGGTSGVCCAGGCAGCGGGGVERGLAGDGEGCATSARAAGGGNGQA